MSKSFKTVVACILAVLMVMFSVPFAALADTTEYTPDIQLQFGTLFQSDGDNADAWVDNVADDYFVNATGKNGAVDYCIAGLSGPQLVATGSVSNDAKYTVSALTIEAADTAAVTQSSAYIDNELEGAALTEDYNLKKGDIFSVTVVMDKISSVFNATAEISYDKTMMEPVYASEFGSGKSRQVITGTAAQLADYMEDATMGDKAMEDFDGQVLYNGVNSDIASVIKTDDDGEKYMYAEGLAPDVANVSQVNNSKAPQLIKADGTEGETYANRMVICTFAFTLKDDISASKPLTFWVHNGDKNGQRKDGSFSVFSEGCYLADKSNVESSNITSYAKNLYLDADHPFDADEDANPGSAKMTFMGKNENVSSPTPVCPHTNTTTTREDVVEATCTVNGSYTEVVTCDDCGVELSRTPNKVIEAPGHDYVETVTPPTCTEQGYTTYKCQVCQDSYTDNYTPASGHDWGQWTEKDPAVPAGCTTTGKTAVEQRICANDNTHVETRGGETIPAAGHQYVPVVTAPTCEEQGYTTYTCQNCQDSYTSDYTDAKGHAYAIESVDWATLNTETKEVSAHYVCSNDSEHTKDETVTATAQVIQEQSETQAEITRFTYEEGNFKDSTDRETKAPAGHTHNLSKTDEVPATCTETGTEAYWTCSGCHKMYSDANAENEISTPVTIPAKGHAWGQWTEVEPAVPAGCTTTGKTAVEQCVCANDNTHVDTRGGVEIPATGHTKGEAQKENEVPATAKEDGSYDLVTRCTECGNVIESEHVVVPATGMTITITKHDIGDVTVNGKLYEGLIDQEVNVAYNGDVKLDVTGDVEYFKGWESNGKIVSTDPAFETSAYTDMTFTPVFEDPSSQKINVIFYDYFGNEVKSYRDKTPTQYQAEITADGIPTAPDYPSLKFDEWDTDANTILGLTTSKTIWGKYSKVDEASSKKFNVTVKDAQGADITDESLVLPAGVQATAVPYDTKVTVKNDNAKGWAIDNVTVSTDSEYSFFVGSDTEITMLVNDEEALPVTTIIGANRLSNDPQTAYRWNIMATRFVPAGYKLVDYGFVYGKNLIDADLNVDNEGKQGNGINSGAVKVARAGQMNSTSNEFALNYGIKAMNGTVTAKSFIVVKKDGVTQTIYSDMAEYNY